MKGATFRPTIGTVYHGLPEVTWMPGGHVSVLVLNEAMGEAHLLTYPPNPV